MVLATPGPLLTPPITSDRKPTQPTTSHSRRERTGWERPKVEEDVDEGVLLLKTSTDNAACVATPQQHQPPPPSKRMQSKENCAPAKGKGPAPAQDRCAAPHGRLRASPVTRPRRRPPLSMRNNQGYPARRMLPRPERDAERGKQGYLERRGKQGYPARWMLPRSERGSE
jgi:hypothetical protein